MCYLIVKKFKDVGSIAIKLDNGNEVAGLSDFLTERLSKQEKQVVTISDLETWLEYAPFNVIEKVGEFIDKAESM